ncbi:MAG: murein biosynthesis integral membrane protein MurJ [Dehalococcoidia bacterium]
MADATAPREDAAASHLSALILAAAIVGFGFLGSRLLGILRTVAIADSFGSGPDADAYFVAFKIPDLIFQVLAGATMGSAFIPVFARVYRRDGTDAAWRLASIMLTIVTAATAVLCAIALIAAPLLVPLTAPGFEGERLDTAITLTRIMLISPLLFAVSGMITGILNARQQFLLPALAPMLYNLAIIFGAVVLARPFGIEGLAIGVVAGSALHLAVQVPGLVKEGMKFRASLNWRAPEVTEIAKLMGPRVIGLGATQLNFVITTFFATKVGGSAVSDLTYAWLLAGLPVALFGMAFSTAVFPQLADRAAEGEHEALYATVSRVLRVILFLTIPAALGLAFLREPVTAFLLQHGEFGPEATAGTSAALAFYCIGLIPQAGIEIHSRGFYALGDTRTPVIFAVVAVVLNLVISAAVYRVLETEGLAFAVSAAAWLEWGLLYTMFVLRTGTRPEADLAAAAKYLWCGAFMVLAMAVCFLTFESDSRVDDAAQALLGGIAGICFYGGMARWMRLPELESALGRVRTVLGIGG